VRRADHSKTTAAAAHSSAARPSTLAGSLSVPNLGFEPRTSRSWAGRLFPVGLDRLGVDDRDRTGDLHLGKVTRCLLRHIHMEPLARFELAPFSVPGRRSAAGATKAWTALGAQGSNLESLSVQSRAGLPIPLPPTRAPTRCYPGAAVLTRNARTLVPGALCARCDSNAHCRRTQRRDSCHWSTSTWSRHPVPTRVSCLTGAGPQPCAAAWLPGLDSNQRGQGSGPCWGRHRPTRNQRPWAPLPL
jgi:hypothetical protein